MAQKKNETFHILDAAHTDPARVKRERNKAGELKKTTWWKNRIATGICEYCRKKFKPVELTMDHIVPIARGGESKKGNVAPACKSCNQNKKLETPVEELFKQLEAERQAKTGVKDEEE